MYEKYQYLFLSYLRICRNSRKPNMDSAELKACVEFCDRCRERLLGMVDLMRTCGEITEKEEKREEAEISESFSSMEILGACIKNGKLFTTESE